MFTRIEKYYGAKNKKQNLMIFTLKKGAAECSGGAVSHVVGRKKVTIRSNIRGWGGIPVHGRNNLRLLRDALIEICKMEGIE